jgi:hypothetical protein
MLNATGPVDGILSTVPMMVAMSPTAVALVTTYVCVAAILFLPYTLELEVAAGKTNVKA